MLNYKLLVSQKWATNRANLGGGENQTFTIGRTKKFDQYFMFRTKKSNPPPVQRNKTFITFVPETTTTNRAVNIKVGNFQSITHADITVDGFTILVGESSQGKSACMRAVNAACNNRFKQGFLKYGTDEIRVDIKYSDDDRTLTVTKNKKDSPTYKLGDTVYQKLNRTVPPEIEDFNGFGVIDNYESKYPLNFFTQFSKPLLLEFSQKRILEILSSSKAFDDMNDAVSKLNKRKEQNNGAFKQLSSMINDNKRQLSEYTEQEESIRDGIKRLSDVSERLKTCETRIGAADELCRLTGAQSHAERRAETLRNIVSLCERVTETNRTLAALDELSGHVTEQTNAKQRTENAQNRLSLCERYILLSDEIKSIRTDSITELEKHITESKQTHGRIKQLTSVLTVAEKCVGTKQSIAETENRLNGLARLSELMETYKNTHKTIRDKQSMVDNHLCPVCGNKIM